MADLQFSTSLLLCIALPVLIFVLAQLKTSSKGGSTSSSSKLPKSYPIIGSFFSISKNRDRLVQWTSDVVTSTSNLTFTLHRTFGVRVVVTANAANVQHVLKSNFQNYEKGDFFKTPMRDFLGDGIFNADGETWKFQRQLASHEFNTKSLRKFVETVVDAELSDRLIPILKDAAANKTVLDFQDILKRFAFDNISKIAFGYDPEYLSPSLREEKFAGAFERSLKLASDRINTFLPNSWKISRALSVGSEKELKIAVGHVRDLARKIIKEKKQELERKSSLDSVDLLSRFLSSGNTDEEFVADIVISFTLAGRDTTSAALTWFFWLLSKHPEVENEILREIKQQSELPDFDQVKGMVYTHAALCESMRLYPPVPVDTKLALSDDVLPDGTVVKKGMRVQYHPYAMGRVAKVWGDDWADFRPERWLEREGPEEKLSFVNRDSYAYPVFQAGPRICLGKEMAFMQMQGVVAGVLRQFRVVPAVAEGVEPVYITDLTAKMKGGLPVTIAIRRPEEGR